MPGPFPGMDPWLEGRRVWKGFHDSLIVKTVEVLQPSLRQAGYFVGIGERVWIADDERELWPDNLIFHRGRPSSTEPVQNVAVADQPVRFAKFEEEQREIFAEIFTRQHDLVCVLEFLSPSNKREGKGRDLYKRKQQELRDSAVHLVEIDLHRAGAYVIDAPEALVAELKPWDYLVNVARRESLEYEVYPIPLQSRLPRISVPLKREDSDAVLDLQQLVNWAYEIGPYPEELDYQAGPTPPLSPEQAGWADEILKSRGLRS